MKRRLQVACEPPASARDVDGRMRSARPRAPRSLPGRMPGSTANDGRAPQGTRVWVQARPLFCRAGAGVVRPQAFGDGFGVLAENAFARLAADGDLAFVVAELHAFPHELAVHHVGLEKDHRRAVETIGE